ncbi:MAG: NAD(P)H-hydrate dehydratase, partial [Ferruginibacter sp.]
MKIFSQSQIKLWEAETMLSQNISELDLIERAASTCFQWIDENNLLNKAFHIFCGSGNNGEDGLALARILIWAKCDVNIYCFNDKQSLNKSKLSELKSIDVINSLNDFPLIEKEEIIIDAIFGTGLNKIVRGLYQEVIERINQHNNTIISLDIASGLFTDIKTESVTIQPTHTLTFQNYKLAFLRPENEISVGQVHILKIGLSEQFFTTEEVVFEMPDFDEVKNIIKPRDRFSNKGTFGHAALFCGSEGMIGAAVLSAKGCLAAGVGKLTCHIPKVGYQIMQTLVPEAMCIINGKKRIKNSDDISIYSAVGIGCGIGKNKGSKWLSDLLKNNIAFVLDADALNWIAKDSDLLKQIPKNSIITPHPGEFERLFGKGDFIKIAMEKAKELGIYILLKGKFTLIATPEGKGYFISTGNPGMAKAGMGDVLTGIITGLRAQNYSAKDSCILGCFIHGLAGDISAHE